MLLRRIARRLLSEQREFFTRADRYRRSTTGYCPTCERTTRFYDWTVNERESGHCKWCGCKSRQRGLAQVIKSTYGGRKLREIGGAEFSILNTECGGPLHEELSQNPRYACSEYLGPEHEPGAIVNRVRHEDLQRTSFDDNSFDLLVSTEVFEHIPDPYAAHREVLRILKPGGHHIFTVPYVQKWQEDCVRAVIEEGKVRHLMCPEYHYDPLRPEGVLVFTIFSPAMLRRLEQIGFEVKEIPVVEPQLGILGKNVVFDCRKPANAG
jgi:SAM-dependent methyltransferase